VEKEKPSGGKPPFSLLSRKTGEISAVLRGTVFPAAGRAPAVSPQKNALRLLVTKFYAFLLIIRIQTF
jgi:hypothetical protein